MSIDFLLTQIKQMMHQQIDVKSLGLVKGYEDEVKVMYTADVFGIYPFIISKGNY